MFKINFSNVQNLNVKNICINYQDKIIKKNKFSHFLRCIKLIKNEISLFLIKDKTSLQSDLRKNEYDDFWSRFNKINFYEKPYTWHEYKKNYFLSPVALTQDIFQSLILEEIRHKKPKKILEVGCGIGLNLFYFAKKFPKIEFVGIDISPRGIEICKKENRFKNYDMGYIYLKDRHNPIFQRKNYFSNFYDFIKSEEFEKEVSKIFNYKNNFFCRNIVTSFAAKNSFLIPHKDSLSKERKDLNLNFIYFIDGNDENIEFSGGTCIFSDNNGKEILLCPSTLKNSVLIYDNTKNFFHGFKILKKNCFRKAVTFQFNQIYKND